MPDDVDEVISTLVAKRTRQPVTGEELIDAMHPTFPTMVSAWVRRARLTPISPLADRGA